eukprot:CAMPEP_0197072554 /NCGR_PEP_ID=MMETSP1384-20130603/210156_1 /TAXON_ID=29189 /ORGANISM="Ammonia sp." /LENGTH=589 /DNA_ID=CAMNT_0042511375 /DNA_START=40 /DNA_END=1809 /DNA_ORIENTATION=-
MSSPKSKKKSSPQKQDEKEKEFEEDNDTKKNEPDCCDRCLFASFGYILLYVGIFVIFFSEREHKYSQRDISYISSNLQLLDLQKQKPGEINTLLAEVVENKYPMHFIDQIYDLDETSMVVMDDRTDLSYPGIALKIQTEMFQWVESEDVSRKEGTTETTSKFSYSKAWSDTFHESSKFNQQDDYYNPQPTVSQLSTRNVWVDDIMIGNNKYVQLHLSKSLYTKLGKRSLWKNVTLKAAEYSDMELWEIRDGYLYRPYDKAESWFAEPEKKEDAEQNQEDKQEEKAAPEQAEDTETETDTQPEAEGESDDTLKAAEYSDMELWEIRDGYLYRPYDKAESWFAEPEKKEDAEQNQEDKQEEAAPEQAQDTDTETETETDTETQPEAEGESDDVFKAPDQEEKERVRLDKPRTMIGDIRMTVFVLDVRGETVTYLGGLKHNEEEKQYYLVPWRSLNNHKFSLLQYGAIPHEQVVAEFSTESVLKLWLTRLFTLIFMFIGFLVLPNVLNTTALMVKYPLTSVPIQTWLHYILAALILSVLLWILIVCIAYVIGIIHLALMLVILIAIGLIVNNKATSSSQDSESKELKTKKDK